MRDLPYLFTRRVAIPGEHRMEPRDVHGLSIQRLGIHAYEYGIHQSTNVMFSPVTSWQYLYDPPAFSSNYWMQWNVNPRYGRIISRFTASPSCKYKTSQPWIFCPRHLWARPNISSIASGNPDRYSGVTRLTDNSTVSIVNVTEDGAPYIRCLACEHWPRARTCLDEPADIRSFDVPPNDEEVALRRTICQRAGNSSQT
jgi:hypothetical protein